MANEESNAAPTPNPLEAAPSQPIPFLPILNSLALLGALGFLYYSKVLYQKVPITESGERERLASAHAVPTSTPVSALISFEPMTVNISPSPAQPLPADGTSHQIQGKLHYATIGFSIEVRDSSRQDTIELLRPLILDKFLQILGRKQAYELTTVQGRFTLRSQLLEAINQIISSAAAKPTKEGLITNVYFSQFLVQ